MEESVFRQKSIDQMTAPEQLSDHLRVITPSIWVILGVIIALIAALFIWASITTVESYAGGKATVDDGTLVLIFDDEEAAKHVESGMMITIGSTETEISMLGFDEDDRYIAFASSTVLPNGIYDARVGYDTAKVISMLFN